MAIEQIKEGIVKLYEMERLDATKASNEKRVNQVDRAMRF